MLKFPRARATKWFELHRNLVTAGYEISKKRLPNPSIEEVQLSLEGPQIIHLPEYLKLDEVDKNKPGVITFVDKDLKPIILKGGFLYSHAKTDGIRG